MAKEKGSKKTQSGRIEERVRELVIPLVEERGFELWDVCFEKEGAMWYLRVLFDKDGGIDSDQCEEITKPINEIIDKQDFIDLIDIVEIGSPGLTKRLRRPEHFSAMMNKPIKAMIRLENGKNDTVYGVLSDYDGDNNTITLKNDSDTVTLNISKCTKINADIKD